jgi:hypothetical protein
VVRHQFAVTNRERGFRLLTFEKVAEAETTCDKIDSRGGTLSVHG